MTAEQIDSMPAGRQMDMLIAEKLMGWRHYPDDLWERMKEWLTQRRELGWDDRTPDEFKPRMMIDSEGRSTWPPHFSEQIEYAMLVADAIARTVLEAQHELGLNYLMLSQNSFHAESRHKFVATFKSFVNDEYKDWWERYDLPFTASGHTAPLAICRAALKTTLQ